ncbi:uncharacterized protein LOC110729152 [Chenopodium quinoa]|uniref:uncharacterized protein LOC110729152 n=1 Tax=Chenopodium quinoa TaxID=63459 RepID=UPI000B7796F1|nr:uncharacterized protein LOC110729152 [Chenopodium quinoa]XP_021764566.1 uncharacterized protein LOC110729152 [Chenopodium quinoa]
MDNDHFVKDGIGHSGEPVRQFAELFSVRIKHDALEKFRVYGTIFVEDNEGNFCIFNRQQHLNQQQQDDDADLINGTLPLTFKRPIRARSIFTLAFDLKDEDGNTIKDKFVAKLVTQKNGNFNKLGVDRMFGSMGCATIYYTFNQAANIYAIKDSIFMKHSFDSANSEGHSWVSGKIVFQYGRPFDSRSRSLATQDLEDDCLDIVLFNAAKPVPLVVDETGSCYKFPLLRSHLVVPHSNSLIFKFDLVYSDKGMVKCIQFDKIIPMLNRFWMNLSDKEGDDMLIKLLLEFQV